MSSSSAFSINGLIEKKSILKKSASWLHLSDIAKSTITQADWYHPRQNIAGFNDDSNEHLIHAEHNPFSKETLLTAEKYLVQNNTRAFLIWHKNKLVHANYINFGQNDVFNSMSLVKTLIGICIGIAIDKRMIVDVNEPAWHYLPEWKHDARQYITIDHLLTMQSGLQSDITLKKNAFLSIINLQFGADIRRTALSIQAVAPPAHKFVYNNYNSQLLGIVLERASGMTFQQFITKYLWQPMQMGNAFAWTDEKGMARTFGGFFARPVDWVKLGSLFINDGLYGDIQIVPKKWLSFMSTPTNTVHRGVKDAFADYGRHIWLESHHYGVIAGIPRIEGCYAKSKHSDDSMVYFEGMRGQYVFVSPNNDLIVMRMGERPKRNWDASYVINMLLKEL